MLFAKSFKTLLTTSDSSTLISIKDYRVVVYLVISEKTSYSFANNISPQKMFTAPKTPRAPMKNGLEKKKCTEVMMP